MILKNKILPFIFFVFVCAIFFIIPSVTHAQTTDSFTIDALVGNDVTPPTIPSNLTTTPITSSQIDLDWDASSDNIGVSGYQVFRDAIQIATTTLTSYSDTGLSSSTLYSYNVTAFDSVPNISTSSATSSTTTLAVVLPPTVEPPPITSTRLQDIEITFLDYEASRNSIDLTFYTNVHSRAVIRWGRTIDYEGGFIASNTFKRNHNTIIDGLEPGSIYEIEIILTNTTGQKQLVRTITVETVSGPDTIPPPNVSNLTSNLLGERARLYWTNPSVEDFSHVRVLSSDYFYPTHIADGWLVYEGDGENVFDDRPILENSRRYYTVFAYDDAGNTSSGAVTYVTRGVFSSPSSITDSSSLPEGNGTSTNIKLDANEIFTFDDVEFEQEGKYRSSFGGSVTLEGDKNTTVSIPYELLPERLKTVVIAIQHPNDKNKVFSFLLRINPQKTAYEAKIGPIGEDGKYVTSVELFDLSTRELFSTNGVIKVVRTTLSIIKKVSEDSGFTSVVQKFGPVIWTFIILILIALLLFLIRRRKSEDRAL